MIPGHCFTNLDDYIREEWPTSFVAVPLVGDIVRSRSGKILKVCRITHYMAESPTPYKDVCKTVDVYPAIKVELHKVIGF